MWRDLDMPSGFAYAKRYRTCKSCIGTDYCRYGLGDSMGWRSSIESALSGLDTPGKLKLATAGCPRNCSEAMVKDVGAVAVEGGKWEIYVGGAAGRARPQRRLLCTVDTPRGGAAHRRSLHPVLPRERQVPRAHLRLRAARRHRRKFAPWWSRTARASRRASTKRCSDRSSVSRPVAGGRRTPATPNQFVRRCWRPIS